MHLILTHEQADFDAISSLLGASLLHPDAYPVLPKRTNRNVRAFLNLYGPELPFIELQDLPNQPVDQITLVDTQSLVTIKGVSAKTKIHVIDHHHLRNDTPEEWNTSVDAVGACTTLFVQSLIERDTPINMVHATLFLLGIYEDTGTLTYISTTPADARVVSHLLELGANLRIVTRYLNPPLTSQQRMVYDRLLANSQKITVHGKMILVAATQAEGMVDEISSIAHKIRDFLDPDGLFLLVKTDEGLRIVARSTTDQINVAEILSHFGGGGHDRAAAALIRLPRASSQTDNSSQELQAKIKQDLIDLLPSLVRPPVTVGEIMSSHPQIIPPEMTALDAAGLMQKYGYEGYPVVSNNKVIGLLTRRAVDRAIAHKLNLSASSLMDAGEYSVHPQDSIEVLQRVMSTSGWGQVPVVDSASSRPIGIVTRTDLLKMITPAQSNRSHLNLASRLDQALPPLRLALLKRIAEKSRSLHQAIYIVGGFVRDLLLDKPGKDFDLVVEGDAIHLARMLCAELGGKVTSHTRFGTAKWIIKTIHSDLMKLLGISTEKMELDLPESIDLISARIEFYDYPTALPTVERSSIKLDLHRRDFTINTMAIRLDGRHYGALYDYWGGFRDLNRKAIRVLHSLSFVDDPTRLLRAVRFEQRFGFKIEDRTRQLIEDARALIHQVSGDRIRHELDLIFSETHALKMLSRLEDLDLLQPIHPALSWTTHHAENYTCLLQAFSSEQWEIRKSIELTSTQAFCGYSAWFISYPVATIAEICDRLRLSNHIRYSLISTGKLDREITDIRYLSPGEATIKLENYPESAIFCVYALSRDPESRALIEKYMNIWRKIRPTITGETLKALNIPPGPHYREILLQLRCAWIDGKIDNPDTEQNYLSWLLNQQQPAE